MRFGSLARAALIGALSFAASTSAAPRSAAAPQEGLPPEVQELLRGDPTGPEERLRKLFVDVERSLRHIDDMLFEAGAGDPLEDDLDSGLGELLDQALERSRSAIDDINEILEIAQQLSSQQSSGGSGGEQQQDPSGSSPLDGRQPPRQGQEQTPENPNQQLDPTQQGEEQQGESQGQQPEDGGDGGPESQQEGAAPPQNAGERAPPGGGADPWGDLPPRVQQIFRTQGGQDMPPAYRGWIDAYHRRLGKTR